MTDDIRREDAGGVITLTFTRDRKLNAVNGDMIEVIRQAVDDLRDQAEHRVMVITAEGRYFTAGADMTALPVGEAGPGVEGSVFRRNYRRLHQLFDEIEAVEKPVISVAQGPCLGIGIELSSSCDFRFAAEGARFGLPEVRNLAALPGSGGIARLTRLVGPHWARWLAMACQEWDAQQALMAGYLHAVYPADELRARVDAFVADLLSQPSEALGVAKIVIDAAAGADRRTARDFDRVVNTALVNSAQFQAKIDEFAARGKKR
jgi:enoyl-CoA hydratase/carnithine racemase